MEQQQTRIPRTRLACQAALALAAVALGALPTHAKVTATTGAGNWNDAIWNNGAPAAGDEVTVGHAVTLTNSTPELATFQNNATLTFGGWNTALRATTVTVNGTITHNAQTATAVGGGGLWVPDNRLRIVCSNLTVNSSKTIDANSKGYPGPTTSSTTGRGPGGPGISAWYGCSASFGGRGSYYSTAAITAAPYGDSDAYGTDAAPSHPGSSGSVGSGGGTAGSGGGAIAIEATGLVTVNGTISANGGNGSAGSAGGGSGGTLYIQCGTIQGSGTISANGGNGGNPNGGSAGGGRLAIVVADSAGQAALPVPNLQCGAARGASNPTQSNENGTYYLTHARLVRLPVASNNKPPVGILLGLPSGWNVSGDLVVSNTTLQIGEGVRVAATGDAIVHASTLQMGRPLRFGSAFRLACRDLTVRNTSTVTLYASGVLPASVVTNHLAPAYGGTVAVARAFSLASGSTVSPWSHGTNGGSVVFLVDSASIAGTIDADYKGYEGSRAKGQKAFGFGAGTYKAGWNSGGGGYGGRGGTLFSDATLRGKSYGVAAAPVAPGSGGSVCDEAGVNAFAGDGGGAIRIAASGNVSLTGSLNARGQNTLDGYSGAGSGGSIFVTCERISGTGTLRVNGGNETGNGNGSPMGGGGRIALVARGGSYDSLTLSVAAGTGDAGGTLPENGSTYKAPIPRGTAVMVR